jgi:BMFP domain-containing protein YqiC
MGRCRPAEDRRMQTQNPLLDEIAKLTTAAMGIAQAAGEEAKAAFRSQTDRLVAEMDLVRREDHDALKAEIAALRTEVEALRAAKPAAKAAPKAAPKAGGAGPKASKPS